MTRIIDANLPDNCPFYIGQSVSIMRKTSGGYTSEITGLIQDAINIETPSRTRKKGWMLLIKFPDFHLERPLKKVTLL